jgi:hypothetical protein
MARFEGEIVIGRPVDVVFDYVADQSNEPQYNLQMVRAEKDHPRAGREGNPVPLGRGVQGARGGDADRMHRLRPAGAVRHHHHNGPSRDQLHTQLPARTRGHPDAVVGADPAQRRLPAARPADHLARETAGTADMDGPIPLVAPGMTRVERLGLAGRRTCAGACPSAPRVTGPF